MVKLKGLLLTEGMHGMISQAEGLAKALDLDFIHQKIELNNLWKLIPPKFTPVSLKVYKNFKIPEFDIIISCGRKSVVSSIYLKKNSAKKIFNIHIQNPKVNLKNFDFVVVPEHDEISGDNVVSTKGAIHYLTEHEINQKKDYLKSFIKNDRRKILTLILGGPTKYYDYSIKNFREIFLILSNLLNQENLQFVVIPSMRTPQNIIDYAKDFFDNNHTIIKNVDKNAYLSALAISDYIVVTCDSSSMISETALTGKPIYVANIFPKKKI